MLIIYGFMMLVFVLYVSFLWIRFGVLPSISESYYRLPKKLKFLFTFFCWGFALPALIIGISLTNNYLMFFAGAGIAFVGVAAAFKEGLAKRIHNIGAVVGIASSQASIAYDFHMYYVNLIFLTLAAIIYFIIKKNSVWWIELVAFSSIGYVLGMQLLLK